MLVDDVLYTGRTVARRDRRALRLRPPARGSSSRCSPTAATASCRSGPTTSARTCRPRAPSASTSASRSIDGVDEVEDQRRRKPHGGRTHEAPAVDRRPRRAPTSSASSTAPRASPRSPGARSRRCPTLRGRTVVNLFYEAAHAHQLLLRAGREAAVRRPGQRQARRAPRSTRASRCKDTVATLSAYDPAAIVIRSPWAGAAELVARWTAAVGGQRRRRQARAPDPGAARPLHAASAGSARSTGSRSGSSATCCTAASRARTSSPSRGWARR